MIQPANTSWFKSLPYITILKYALIVIALALIGAGIGWLAVSLTLTGETIVVPDFTGLSLIEAMQKAKEDGLLVVLKTQQYDQFVPKDFVISQDPQAGLSIKKGRKIQVTVSNGPEESIIPDLADLPWREAESHLARVSLQVGMIARVHSEHYERDKIITQQPLPGQKSVIEEKINFLVSLGPQPRHFVTPDFIGKNISYCRDLLSKMQLRLEITDRIIAPDYQSGTILDQTPQPGFRIREGDIVRIKMSRKSRLEDEQNLKFYPFAYKVPPGLFPKKLRIILVDADNQEIELLHTEVQPGERKSLLIPKQAGALINVYLDGELVHSEAVEHE